jgi:uncharacterized protein YkwD
MKKLLLILLTFSSQLVLSQSVLDSLVVVKINEFRGSQNLPQLQLDTQRRQLALDHSTSLSDDSLIGHSDFEFKLTNNFIGENISHCNLNVRNRNFDPVIVAEKIVKLWIDSPGHRQVLLGLKYSKAGCATVMKRKPTGILNVENVTFITTLLVTD